MINGLCFKKGEHGRSDRIRTYDPLIPNEVRYQAALHSDMFLMRLRSLRTHQL